MTETLVKGADFYTIDSVVRATKELGDQIKGHIQMHEKYGDKAGSLFFIQSMLDAQTYARERRPEGVSADVRGILRRYEELSRTYTDPQLGLMMGAEFGDKVNFCSLIFREGPIKIVEKSVLSSRQWQENVDAGLV